MSDDRMKQSGSRSAAIGTFLGMSGLVVLLTSSTLGLYFFGTASWLTLGPIGVSLVFLAAWLVLSFQRLTERLSQRQAQYFGLTAGYTVALTVLISGGNWFLAKKPITFDLSAAGVHSLSEQTTKVLKNLSEPVRVTAFLEKSDPAVGVFESVAQRYRTETDKVEMRVLSPSFAIEEVRRFKVTADGPSIIAETKWDDPINRKEARFRIDMRALNHEETFTNAIINASLKSRPKILVTTGHGEADVSDPSTIGLRETSIDLANEGFDVIPFNYTRVGAIPDDVAALVVAGPRTPFLEPEVEAIRAWLEKGGRLALFLEPQVQSGLESLVGAYGVQVNNDIVIDVSPFGRIYGDKTAIASDYGPHPIVEKFMNVMTIFPEARSVSVNPVANVDAIVLARTSEKAWGETDFVGLSQSNAQWDSGEVRGPVNVAVACERPEDEGATIRSRVVVVGDSTFATNENRRLGGNRNLVLNIIGWLIEDEDKIAIRPRTRGANLIVLTPSQREGISFFVLYVLPVSLLALGLGIWLVRRQR
jgi:ABC-type uncharacterized transport system involved in gliding motility auxiliary subunit